ncbi:putative phosphoribosyltransferase [Microbacterium keratanolyticum]|uniref:phosphoribosyltransferase n=1 Tax=Microbacterium keratanolyticum TaxID=67574 RepID=UPI00195C7068|nr:phosphoribosyltransferase [Microbacterium keratanolyticum]MBM7469273.1 putative phosphoribosyltransferase [Microbacterium keratanolyticum]
MDRFRDRDEAGRLLADRLTEQARPDAVVLALPRGGVPVAAVIAARLGMPLDVLVVRKLGVPWHSELAMGAVGEEGATVLNDDVIAAARIDETTLQGVIARERSEVTRRVDRFRGARPPVPLAGRRAIIVDDGVATGATARAGCAVARLRGAASVVLAVPVGAPSVIRDLREVADEIICLHEPPGFMAVGMHYLDFRQVEDAEVGRLLRAGR